MMMVIVVVILVWMCVCFQGDANRSEADDEGQSLSYEDEEKLRDLYAAGTISINLKLDMTKQAHHPYMTLIDSSCVSHIVQRSYGQAATF